MGKLEYTDFVTEDGKFDWDTYKKKFGSKSFFATIIFWVALIAFGYFCVMSAKNIYENIMLYFDYDFESTVDLSSVAQNFVALLEDYGLTILLIFVYSFIISFVASMASLQVMKIIGAIFLWFLVAITFVATFFVLYLMKEYTEYKWIFILISALPMVILLFFWRNMKIASRLINITADMLMKNKRIFFNGIYFGIMNVLLLLGIQNYYIYKFVDFTSSPGDIIMNWQTTNFATAGGWEVIGMTFLYYFLVQVSYNYYYGSVIAQAHGYYRYAKLGWADGARITAKRMRALVTYATFSAILFTITWILRQFAKRSKDTDRLKNLGIRVVLKGKRGIIKKQSWGQRLANWAIGLLEKLWMLVNFFTLPAIIIENKSAPGGIKKSFKYMITNIANVFVRKTAVRHVFRFTTFLYLFICAIGGAAIGLLTCDYFGLDQTTAMITFSILSVGVAGIPAWVMTKNLDIVYLTFLYCYILDEDLYKKEGVENIPSRFFGDVDKLAEKAKKEVTYRKKTRIGVYIAMILSIVAMGVGAFVVFTLFGVDSTIINDAGFHPWLETMSWNIGYIAIFFAAAGFFAILSRRKGMMVLIGWGLLVALATSMYISYYRPGLTGTVPWDFNENVFVYFRYIILGGLLASLGPPILGGMMQIAKIA
ncbi:MAG: hypothetical protein ACFFCS_16365 [Candidatus Hodarchaeota archaeon]